MALSPAYSSPTLNDFLNKDANAAYYKSMGADQGGDNETSAFMRRLLPGYGQLGAQGLTQRIGLEPQRQGAINALVANSNPANMVANAGAQAGNLYQQGSQQGLESANVLAQRGAGAGAQYGAITQGQNQGTAAGNQLKLKAQDPTQQNQALMQMLQAIQSSSGEGLEALLSMFGALETRSNANKADKAKGGLGGLLGAVGQIAGMTSGFGGLGALTGGSSGGLMGGSNASSGLGNTGVPY